MCTVEGVEGVCGWVGGWRAGSRKYLFLGVVGVFEKDFFLQLKFF